MKLNFSPTKYRNILIFSFVTCLLSGLFILSITMPKEQGELNIRIEDKHGARFINKSEIKDFVRKVAAENPEKDYADYDLKVLEDRLNAIDFIRSAQVARDLKGNLFIDIAQDRPIARIISSKGNYYINQDKQLVELSPSYTARVLLIGGKGARQLLKPHFFESAQGAELFEMIDYLNREPFWQAQVSQINLNERLEIQAIPQVGKEKIEFGQAKDFRQKLGKLKVYYNEIIPRKGWNTYKTVKLQYKDQIVCK